MRRVECSLARLLVTAAAASAGLLARWVRQRVASQGLASALGWSPSILYAFGLVIFLLSFRLRRPFRWALATGGAVGALAYEFAQSGLPGRTYDIHDVVATMAGAALAFALDRAFSPTSRA